MKNINAILLLIVFFLASAFTCLVPYPVTTSNTILNKRESSILNDLHETENVNYINENQINILNLDWFDAMNSTFTKYKTVKVIDCQTLKSYYVKRTGGSNHADVETISSADTEIFKSLYGEWSWTRRPVFVEIDNKYYAGSINGYPHGYSTIENNNENGHTCIHFLNSKTHGTKRVDESHQNAISTAYKSKDKLIEYIKK